MITANKQFYNDMQPSKVPLCELLKEERFFSSLPEDWHVIITDIVNSTLAVSDGRHHDVNLIATGSMVIVLNAAFSRNVCIPFFFGGDGATFLVPECVVAKAMQELELYQADILKNFNLHLRAGSIAVKNIYSNGHQINIAKFSSSNSFDIPIVLGDGLAYAERLIKSKDFKQTSNKKYETPQENEVGDGKPNMKGMTCRWDTIDPPKKNEEIVTLLVMAKKDSEQSITYRKILEIIDELYGSPETRQPISIAKLQLNSTFKRLGAEMRVRLGTVKIIELLRTWIYTQYVRYYFKTKNGREYLKTLVEMSDTLIIDGRINTIICGTADQRKSLEQLLDEMELKQEIIYGMHISSATVMSCYVRNLEGDHVHFVDGADGSYTKAAIMLKAKHKYVFETEL